jgi:hypothetical protein
LSGSAPIQYNNGTGAISITQAGTASNGFLSSTDWNTFNNKAPSVVGGYLALSGGTMTGPINLVAEQYYEASGVFGLDANNSDIIGVNGIYFDDPSDGPNEGLNFYRSAGYWDSLYSLSGVLYYNPNRASNAAGTPYTVWTTQNLINPVKGTGVTQGIAYWTSTSEIGAESDFAYEAANNRVRINSSVWDSGGAAAKLIVSGVLAAGSSATVQINGFIRIRDQIIIHNETNTLEDAYIQTVGTGVLRIGNKLLINTSLVDSYQLDVNGTGRFSGDLRVTTGNKIYFETSGTGNSLYREVANGNTVLTSAADTRLTNSDSSVTYLRLAASTGAAIFSSSVTAGDGTQTVETDATITIRKGVAFAGLDLKSNRIKNVVHKYNKR